MRSGCTRQRRALHAHAEFRACGEPAAQYRPRYQGVVPSLATIVAAMRANPRNIRHDDLARVCEHYFGPPRTAGGSHAVFTTPWPGDPRVTIQNDHGQAKAYQVRQVLAAIDKKESWR
jgi:hypothetical protein